MPPPPVRAELGTVMIVPIGDLFNHNGDGANVELQYDEGNAVWHYTVSAETKQGVILFLEMFELLKWKMCAMLFFGRFCLFFSKTDVIKMISFYCFGRFFCFHIPLL